MRYNQSVMQGEMICVGQNVDVCDRVKKWVNGEVVQVRNGYAYIHYTGWSANYDEEIDINSERILTQWVPGRQPVVNNRVDAYHSLGGWLEARVYELREDYDPVPHRLVVRQVKVHFLNYHPKYDLWLDPLNPNEVATIGSKSKARGTGRCRASHKAQPFSLSELAKKILCDRLQNMILELRAKQLVLKEVVGDGNCLFRSISDQLYGCEKHYAEIRELCMRYIASEKAFFQDYVVEDIEAYVARKSQDGVWGDDVEIQAVSEIYGRPIEIYATGGEPLRTFHEEGEVQPLRLAYIGSCHYNSIQRQENPHSAILSTHFGEHESLFWNGYQSNPAPFVAHRNAFALNNTLDDAIEERAEAYTKQGDQTHHLEKVLEMSETEALLKEIEISQIKELKNKYEQELIEKELKEIEDKEIEQAKLLSSQKEKPYWFGDLLAQGFSHDEIFFAIEVKGEDPDAVHNFLFDQI